MAENNQQSETQKVLRAAQIMLDQGNIAAAEAIFQKILAEVGDETMEGALCLSNLTDILEAKGEIGAAVDCGMRLLRHPRSTQPPTIEAARAEQAADMMNRLGRATEATELKMHAEQIYKRIGPEESIGQPKPLSNNDPNWLLHALQNGAYKAFERVRRQQHFQPKPAMPTMESRPQEQAFTPPPSTTLAERGMQASPAARSFNDALENLAAQESIETPSSEPSAPALREAMPDARESQVTWGERDPDRKFRELEKNLREQEQTHERIRKEKDKVKQEAKFQWLPEEEAAAAHAAANESAPAMTPYSVHPQDNSWPVDQQVEWDSSSNEDPWARKTPDASGKDSATHSTIRRPTGEEQVHADADPWERRTGEASVWDDSSRNNDIKRLRNQGSRPGREPPAVHNDDESSSPAIRTSRSRTAELRSLDSPSQDPNPLAALMHRLLGPSSNEVDSSMPQTPGEAPRNNPAVNFVAIVAIIFIILFAVWRLAPRSGNAEAMFDKLPHRYKDSTQTLVMSLSNVHNIEMTSGSDSVQANLEYYFGDWRDIVTLAFATNTNPPFYLYPTTGGLRDQNKTTYYVADGPDLQLSSRCRFILDDANAYFEENKKYPEKVEDGFKPVDITYENPFTKKSQDIQYECTQLGKGDSDEAVDGDRAEFYYNVSKASFWNDPKTKMQPGGIRCISAIFKSGRGDINSFVVSAADNNGDVLTGRKALSAFTLVAEDGKEKVQEQPPLKHNFTAWLTVVPITAQDTFWLNNLAWMIFGTIAFMTLAVGLGSPRQGPIRPMWFSISGVFGLVAAFYLGIAYFRGH